MLPSDDCNECTMKSTHMMRTSKYFSHVIFLVVFLSSAFLAVRKGLPAIAPYASEKHNDSFLPLHNHDRIHRKKSCLAISSKRLMTLVFATNIALSAVLVVLLLCEISNLLDPVARSEALEICLPMLMIQLVLVSPALQLQSILAAFGLNFATAGKNRAKLAWLFELIGLFTWLCGFWYVGEIMLDLYLRPTDSLESSPTFSEGCLERIGVAGISLMACLSGFAAVSAVWQTFIARAPVVTDVDINKRQTGLDATEEMIRVKQSRLRALDHRINSMDTSSGGIISTVIGSIRSNNEEKERSLLHMELSGLESIRMSMETNVFALRAQKKEQEKSRSWSGRLLLTVSYIFAIYCVFRLGSISIGVFKRLMVSTGSTDDPVTFLLGVLAKHWDPKLNRSAWTRQISFLLSGVLLLAAFNSALQTFLLLARAFPGLAASAANFRDATTLALLISQVIAAYVISSAILLRSNLPKDVGSVISDALGAPLEPWRVEVWFDAWFLCAASLTAFGIWVGRKMRTSEEHEEVSEKRN